MSREKELRRILEKILEAPFTVKTSEFKTLVLHKEVEREAKRALSRPQRTIH